MENRYHEYCTGCGLCHDQCGVNFTKDDCGCLYPENLSSEAINFCNEICPVGENGITHEKGHSLWGNYVGIFRGYAKDAGIRYAASSGGVITALASFLINKKYVDGIIQVKASNVVPYQTVVVCSKTESEVRECCGSRYSQSAPLYNISKLIEPNKKYAFIGKPCDVRALRNLMQKKHIYENQIVYLLSFFCAGTPTERANKKLLSQLQCDQKGCVSLFYRGNGWPGYTKALHDDGSEDRMEYEKSWMNILGRDIRKSCKFCFDGIGEASDISCGDLWNLGADNKPDFSESEGQNVVFSWSQKGADLLAEAAKEKYIEMYVDDGLEKTLEFCQPNHKNKRGTAFYKIIAMKCLLKSTPKFDLNVLKHYSCYVDRKTRFNTFKGTVKRVLQKKI